MLWARPKLPIRGIFQSWAGARFERALRGAWSRLWEGVANLKQYNSQLFYQQNVFVLE